jgi:Ca2+-dependent lipid-binding protein
MVQTLSPDWDEERILMKKLCAGTLTDTFIIQVWDYDSVSKDDFMGMVETSVAELLKVSV